MMKRDFTLLLASTHPDGVVELVACCPCETLPMNRNDLFSFDHILTCRGHRFYSIGIAKLVLTGMRHSHVLNNSQQEDLIEVSLLHAVEFHIRVI